MSDNFQTVTLSESFIGAGNVPFFAILHTDDRPIDKIFATSLSLITWFIFGSPISRKPRGTSHTLQRCYFLGYAEIVWVFMKLPNPTTCLFLHVVGKVLYGFIKLFC
jgi:hypothetical protein